MSHHSVIVACAVLAVGCTGEVIVSEGAARQPPLPIDERGCTLALDGQIRGAATAEGELSGPCRCDGEATRVADASQLAAAMSGAGCVALEAGDYGAVDVPAGVQLVGASVAGVRFASLNVADGASVCRATVTNGLAVRGRGVELKYLSIATSVDDGVVVHAGSSVTLVGSTVSGANRYGVSAFDAERVDVVDSVLADNGGPGLWMQCGGGCDCSHTAELSMRNTLVRDNALVGVSLIGTNAVLSQLQIARTKTGNNFQHGGGLAASGCSTLTADNVRVEENADFGMLLDHIGSAMDCVHVARNLRGVWFQDGGIEGGVGALRRATIEGNEGIGIGMCGFRGSQAGTVTIEETTVRDTECIVLPVLIGGVSAGSEEVGAGIAWHGSFEAHMRDVAIVDSCVVDLLIDGPANGSLDDVSTSSGRILQRNYEGGPQPSRSGSTPPIETEPPTPSTVGLSCLVTPL